MRGIWRLPMTIVAIAIAPIAGSAFVSYGSCWPQLEPRLGAGRNCNKLKISQGGGGCGRPTGAAGLRASWVNEQVSLEIPTSSETAYSVYADLRRQPEWSPWLKSVEHEKESGRSTWVIQSKGIKVSWDARNTVEVPGTEVAWESTTGLQNKGRVTFENMDDSRCLMTLTLSYDLPGAIASVLQLDAVRKFVRWTILSDLGRFKKVAIREVPATVSVSAVSRPVAESPTDGGDPCPPAARVAEEVGVASGRQTFELEIPSKPPKGSIYAGKDDDEDHDDDGRGNRVDLNGGIVDESEVTVEDGIPVGVSQASELTAGLRDETNNNDETGTGTKLSNVEDGIPVDMSQASELAAGLRDETNDNDETGTGTKLTNVEDGIPVDMSHASELAAGQRDETDDNEETETGTKLSNVDGIPMDMSQASELAAGLRYETNDSEERVTGTKLSNVEDGIPVNMPQASELVAGLRDETDDIEETGTGTKLSESLGATSSPSNVEKASEKKGPRPAADDASAVDAPMAEPRRGNRWLERIQRRRGAIRSGGESGGLGNPSGEARATGNLGFRVRWRRRLRRLWLRLRGKGPD